MEARQRWSEKLEKHRALADELNDQRRRAFRETWREWSQSAMSADWKVDASFGRAVLDRWERLNPGLIPSLQMANGAASDIFYEDPALALALIERGYRPRDEQEEDATVGRLSSARPVAIHGIIWSAALEWGWIPDRVQMGGFSQLRKVCMSLAHARKSEDQEFWAKALWLMAPYCKKVEGETACAWLKEHGGGTDQIAIVRSAFERLQLEKVGENPAERGRSLRM